MHLDPDRRGHPLCSGGSSEREQGSVSISSAWLAIRAVGHQKSRSAAARSMRLGCYAPGCTRWRRPHRVRDFSNALTAEKVVLASP